MLLDNFGIAYFTGIIYKLEFVRVCHLLSGDGILKYFYLITGKKATPEEKDPPEGKELTILSGPLSKVIPSSSIVRYNVEVTKVPKQAKWSVTPHCYMKQIPA